jgi:hypothetical protein
MTTSRNHPPVQLTRNHLTHDFTLMMREEDPAQAYALAEEFARGLNCTVITPASEVEPHWMRNTACPCEGKPHKCHYWRSKDAGSGAFRACFVTIVRDTTSQRASRSR